MSPNLRNINGNLLISGITFFQRLDFFYIFVPLLNKHDNFQLMNLHEYQGKEILASVLYKKFNMNKNQWDYHFGGKEKRNVSLLKDRKIRLYKINKKGVN